MDSSPDEPLELAVWAAGVVDEAGVVSFAPLPDLVVAAQSGVTFHDIYIVQVASDSTNELADRNAALERLDVR